MCTSFLLAGRGFSLVVLFRFSRYGGCFHLIIIGAGLATCLYGFELMREQQQRQQQQLQQCHQKRQQTLNLDAHPTPTTRADPTMAQQQEEAPTGSSAALTQRRRRRWRRRRCRRIPTCRHRGPLPLHPDSVRPVPQGARPTAGKPRCLLRSYHPRHGGHI